MSTSRIIVIGSINTDLVIRGPRLPAPGETVLGGEFYRAAGGKGANQAVAAARASAEPITFIGAVGDDAFGHEALEALAAENLDLRLLKTIAGRPSGVALILVDHQGENSISVASGANADLSHEDVDAVPDEVFTTADVLLTCLESPLETVGRALLRAKQAATTTILNPAPAVAETCRSGLLPLVDVITPNAGEAAALTGIDTADRSGAVAAARQLQRLGCPACVITLGSRGCLVVQEEATWLEGLSAKPVDSTAAGDAFNGALAVALSEGRSLVEAARWANRAGAIAVTRDGAQPSLPSRAEIEAFGATAG